MTWPWSPSVKDAHIHRLQAELIEVAHDCARKDVTIRDLLRQIRDLKEQQRK